MLLWVYSYINHLCFTVSINLLNTTCLLAVVILLVFQSRVHHFIIQLSNIKDTVHNPWGSKSSLLFPSALRADPSRKREAESAVTRHGPGAGRLEATAGEGHTGQQWLLHQGAFIYSIQSSPDRVWSPRRRGLYAMPCYVMLDKLSIIMHCTDWDGLI